ncbi:hypothetical protein HYFRA_00013326 [Hymenoscyphus fraxineus]|uniref:Uncharacterized protein n=1 Tax=Hymenoscyphus fraxineus TaxID=746836 RepID=A0A9N9L8F0_9HELO|nr:hypothetical protein HYFRA_00013326 [Hymenoscyphus fraxineus]
MASQKRPSNLFTGTLPSYVRGAARGVPCIQCTKSALRGPLAPACHDTAGRSARCHRCCTNHLSCFPLPDEAIPLVRKLRSELHRKGEADSDVIKFREVLTTLLRSDAELKAAAVTETETQLAKSRTVARIAGESLVKATLTKTPTTTLGPKKNSKASSSIKSSKISEVSRESRAPILQGPRNKNQPKMPQSQQRSTVISEGQCNGERAPSRSAPDVTNPRDKENTCPSQCPNHKSHVGSNKQDSRSRKRSESRHRNDRQPERDEREHRARSPRQDDSLGNRYRSLSHDSRYSRRYRSRSPRRDSRKERSRSPYQQSQRKGRSRSLEEDRSRSNSRLRDRHRTSQGRRGRSQSPRRDSRDERKNSTHSRERTYKKVTGDFDDSDAIDAAVIKRNDRVRKLIDSFIDDLMDELAD